MIGRKLAFETFEPRTLLAAGSGDVSSATSATLYNLRPNPIHEDVARVVPLMTTTGDPINYESTPGEVYEHIPLDGIVRLDLTIAKPADAGWCSGSLLPDGRHILTAAHCVYQLPLTEISVLFELPSGNQTRTVSLPEGNIYIPPEYDGNAQHAADITILELDFPAPAETPRFDIYRDTDEIGNTIVRVSYGVTGTGHSGEDIT